MKFLQIQNSSEPRIIGTTNGVYQVEINEKLLSRNKSYKEIESVFFSPFPDVSSFNSRALKVQCPPIQAKLVKKAFVTDLMGFSPYFAGCSYIVSLKFLDHLREFGIDTDKFNLLPVSIKGIDSLAYILFVPMVPMACMDFEKSRLVDSSNPYEKRLLRIKSYQEFLDNQNSGIYFDFHQVCIPEEYQKNSILNLQAESNVFFSEELIHFLMNKRVSSFEVSNRQTKLIFN